MTGNSRPRLLFPRGLSATVCQIGSLVGTITACKDESSRLRRLGFPKFARLLTKGRRVPGDECHVDDNKILMVDDDKDTCSNLSDILNDLGYSVDVAYRGLDGLDLLKERPYRLALLDYKLPCMTGVELFQQMRQIRENIEGFLVTGYASNETTVAALAAGLRHVISKPVSMLTFLPLVEQALADLTSRLPSSVTSP